jgi:UDP-GlcNAc3NAcA epimerase
VHQTGDVMYDSVLFNTKLAENRSAIMEQLGLAPKSYYLATIHRAENTDDAVRMNDILSVLGQMKMQIVLPMHPRTRNILGKRLANIPSNIRVLEPVAYLDMLILEKNSRLILTDSGGVQKEAYWFSVPCITLRDETEWVELVQAGCNQVAGARIDAISTAVKNAEHQIRSGMLFHAGELYGNGRSAEKIVSMLFLSKIK